MKAFRILLVLALAFVALGFSGSQAKAVGAFTYTSSINLQNLENAQADITLYFYNADGSQAAGTPITDTIDPNGSAVYFPLPVSSGFNGSVVVASTTQVASISNVLGNGGAAAASYIAQSQGSSTALIPVLMYANGGFSTWYNVQNTNTTTGATAHVEVAYSDGKTASADIAPGAAHTFDQTTEGHAAKSVFAATITANQPVAVTVIEESTKILFAYNGFANTQAVSNPIMPLVQANNAGYQTGITVQNSGDQATDVTITYKPNPNAGTQCTEKRTIAAHNQKTYMFLPFQNVSETDPSLVTDCMTKNGGKKFVGAAQVTTNSAAMPLVAVANQLKGSLNGEAYSAFDPSVATGKVVLPLIMNANGGYYTSINLANVGGTETTVTCTYTGSSKQDQAVNLQPGAGAVFLNSTTFGAGVKYVGSATCTADRSGKIFAIVNELGASTTSDQLLVYEGISMP